MATTREEDKDRAWTKEMGGCRCAYNGRCADWHAVGCRRERSEFGKSDSVYPF